MKHKPKNIFGRVGGLSPSKSMFDLSYEKKMTADMGYLYPIMCDEVVPGDFFKIGNQAVIRFQPMVAPILHEINMYVHYFFVPYRLLWDEWETFISGGVTGDETPVIPTWEVENPDYEEGTLWDYLGFPPVEPYGAYPIDFPRRAYNLVWNEYYRDQNLQTEVSLSNTYLLNRNWEKDYFTSALPWQQRGTTPALPVNVTGHANWLEGFKVQLEWPEPVTATENAGQFEYNDDGGPYFGRPNDANTRAALMQGWVDRLTLNENQVIADSTSFDIADLRLAFQIQKWMERNARAGARYTEFLQSHFGVSPRDDRLQRPEYIGGSKAPVIISEVLQTSSTDTESPQGNLAGHGITISDAYCGKYRADEFGLIIGIMSVMPRTAYQNGINKQWLRKSKYDFYFPEFANLSEQAIIKAEIAVKDQDPTHNNAIFGYQGRYDEMRVKHSQVCGQMRSTYDYWHLGRQFEQNNLPSLNSAFIKCEPRKDFLAVPTEPAMIISFGNLIKAFRPMPVTAEPGLIDHN